MSNKKWKNVYCCNCGKLGHIYRNCEDPITSFGVITFKLDSDVEEILRQMIKTNNEENNKVIIAALKDNIKLLMIRRKDTFGFVEILRGQYSISNIELLQRFFDIMTMDEKKRIRTKSFDELWNTFWMIDKNSRECNEKKYKRYNSKEYKNSKIKFMKLKKGIEDRYGNFITIDTLIQNSKYNFVNPEWGFPKGRKNIKESNIECALREFNEETGVERDDHYIINEIQPIEEKFIGTNMLEYKHVYYISRYNSDNIVFLNKNSMTQISEISAIEWNNSDNAKKIIRLYNKEKKCIVDNVMNKIINYIIVQLSEVD